MARRPETPSPLKTGHLLRQLKELHFVGRGQEMSLLQDFAGAEGSAPPFFYLQGLPGIGKSALLDALRRWMETQPATYAYVDGRRLDTKTPEELLQHMAQALGLRHARPDLQAILSHLQALSRKKPAMLVIDSYDDLLPLDNWLREKFLAQLSLKVKVILAGRRPLPSPWTHSAGWRLLVKHHTLGPLQREEVAELLLRLQVKEDNPRLWWQHSHGHPLTLHLMIFAHLEGRLPDPARGLYDSRITLGLLENFWRDPISPRTKELLLAASWPFAFDRSLLETILEEPVSVDEFHELVQCPIVQREGKAWTLAEPFHTALRSYFLHHDPEKAHGCRKRLLEMEKRRVMEKALHEDSVLSLAEFCRWSGDPFLETLATPHFFPARYQVQKAEPHHRSLIEAYLARPLSPVTWKFTSPWDGRTLSFIQDPQEVARNREKAEIDRHVEDPQSSFWLLTNDEEGVQGLAVVQTAGKDRSPTLLHLETLTDDPLGFVHLVQVALWPLTEQKRMAIHRPPSPLRHLLRLCGVSLAGEILVVEWSPEILARFLSGGEIRKEPEPQRISPPSVRVLPRSWETLSNREKEVALLAAEGLSNEEVAKKLYVTEATVKKHLTSIYEKLGIRSRVQLIRALAPATPKPETEP